MRILFASTFLLGVALCTPAQDSQTQIRAAVQPILTRQQDAWNQRDLEAFMSGYWNSPDLTFFSGANAITGWEPTLEQYRKRYQSEGRQMGQFQFSDVQITPIAPDAVFVRGAWKLTMNDGKAPHGLFTLIFRKFSSGWKNRAPPTRRLNKSHRRIGYPRPIPLSIAALARRSASRLCSRGACSIENQSSCPINSLARA